MKLRPLRYLVVCLPILMLGAYLASAPGDDTLFPGKASETRPVMIVDHGFHAGLIVRAADLRAAAAHLTREDRGEAHILRTLTERFRGAEWLEIGWGDQGFYRNARSFDDVTVEMVARALLTPSPSVLQVVPLYGPPEQAFELARLTRLALSDEGLTALARELSASFVTDAGGTPRPDGASLYGFGAFFAARPSYHLFRTCNHWLSALLRGAGCQARGSGAPPAPGSWPS